MMTHKICFSEEIWIIIPKLSLLLLIWSPEIFMNISVGTIQELLPASVKISTGNHDSSSSVSEPF